MQNILTRLTIRMKLWIGFSLILAIFSLSSMVTLVSLSGVGAHVNDVVKDRQPTLILAKDLEASLEEAAGSLGFYLLTKEAQHLEEYNHQIKQAEVILQQLERMPVVAQDSRSTQLVGQLHLKLAAFKSTGKTLLDRATSYESNFPGIAYANEQINPLSRVHLQLTSQMIMSEMEEAAGDERRQLLANLAELRYAWSNIMNGIRGYLAFRNDANIKDMSLYIERTDRVISFS